MTLNRRLLLATLASLPVPAIPLARAQSGPALAFTAIPDQDESRLVERFGRVAAYLQDKLGVAVRYVPVKSYPAAVTAFTNDQVQLAWFGGFTGVQARRTVPGSEAIAQGVEDTAFKSFFIAHAGTGLARGNGFPAGIAGRSFTFGARASTSGRVMPEYYIRKQFNRAPEAVFSRVGFSGDHTRTLQLVQSGAFEVGAMDYTVFDLEQKAGRVDPAQVGVIWETPPFPDYNWTVRGDVDTRFGAGFKERLRAALVGCKDPAILAPFGRSGFIPAGNAQYDPVEQVALAAELLNEPGQVPHCAPNFRQGRHFSLSLRERVGVRGSSRTSFPKVEPHAVSTGNALLRSQVPLTPTLSRREREHRSFLFDGPARPAR